MCLIVFNCLMFNNLPRNTATAGPHGFIKVVKQNDILGSRLNLICFSMNIIFPTTSHMNFWITKLSAA